MSDDPSLSRRERQIMEIVYAKGEASATDVLNEMPDPPTRTAVRTFLRILEEKGHLKHRKESREFIYAPVRPRDRAGKSAFRKVLETFFGGSISEAVAAHLADPRSEIPQEEVKRLSAIIEEARKKEHRQK